MFQIVYNCLFSIIWRLLVIHSSVLWVTYTTRTSTFNSVWNSLIHPMWVLSLILTYYCLYIRNLYISFYWWIFSNSLALLFLSIFSLCFRTTISCISRFLPRRQPISILLSLPNCKIPYPIIILSIMSIRNLWISLLLLVLTGLSCHHNPNLINFSIASIGNILNKSDISSH